MSEVYNNDTLATELLKELKASAKRWFIISMVELAMMILLALGFLWYISLPVEEGITTQTVDNVDTSDVRQVVGDYNGESDTDSILQEAGSTQ